MRTTRALAKRWVVNAGLGLLALLTACPQPEPPPTAWLLWSEDVNSVDNPLPDERLEDGTGALDLSGRERFFLPFLPDEAATHETEALLSGWTEILSTLEGWGAFAPIFLLASEPLDPASLDSGALQMVSLDDDDAEIGVRAKWHANPGFLEVEPRLPMLSGQRYALVVGSGLLTASGEAVGAPAGYLDAQADNAIFAAAIEQAGLSAEEVALVVSWQVDDAVGGLMGAAEQLVTHVPTFDVMPEGERLRGVFESETFADVFPDHADALVAAGRVAVGAMPSFELRTEGFFDPAKVEDVTSAEAVRLEVVIVEPDAEQFPPPWPVILMQHGFGSSNRFLLENAREPTEAGYALIGIDAAAHGSRGNFIQFFNVEDPRVMRDNFQQTIVDLLQVERLARDGVIDLDGVPGNDFDGSVRYFGHSMGSILGTVAITLMPEAPDAVLSAAGGGISNILQSEIMQTRVELLILPALGLDYQSPGYEPSLPFLTGMLQTLIDRTDPIAFARHTFARRPAYASGVPRLLIQQGFGDRMVSNATTTDLAAALGMPFLEEAQEAAEPVSGVWSSDPLQYGVASEVDPHDTYFHVPGVRAQMIEYMTSSGTHVIDPAAVNTTGD